MVFFAKKIKIQYTLIRLL